MNNCPHWDVFCKVIDNFGDIGVSWRLARQLQADQQKAVRLWVDDLRSFQRICSTLNVEQAVQIVRGIEIRHWSDAIHQQPDPAVTPADVVIETFACTPPQWYIEAMAERPVPPVWLNLEYLSAESWTETCHGLPSPHPTLPLQKYFFFPGFTERTGGLLIEANYTVARQAYIEDVVEQQRFWTSLGFENRPTADLQVFLFSYAGADLGGLFHTWATGGLKILCMVAPGDASQAATDWMNKPLQPGDAVRIGQLTLMGLPFVEQEDFDRLLWSADLNFVRGEDSFIRAQLAGKPMVWHIYPQEEEAHLVKLDAFLDRYTATMPDETAVATRNFWHTYNAGKPIANAWHSFFAHHETLNELAVAWQTQLLAGPGLVRKLVNFCENLIR